jgi:nucleoside-diphosphate-sugar epimerase
MTGQIEQFTVLGAGGFVGSHLTRYLGARGLQYWTPDRDNSGLFDRPLGHVIYCIGLTADYLDRAFDTIEAHVTLFSRLLRDAEFNSVVYLSSTRLYDSGDGNGREETDLFLNPANPRHLYDFSKGLGETLCKVCGDGKARVARLSCVYADDLSGENFLHGLIEQALAASEITLETHPDFARDYIHMDDVCEALINIATKGYRHIYNVASGTNITNRALFDLIRAHTGCTISAIPSAGMTGAVAPIIDVNALREDFSQTPRDITTALPALIAANRRAPAIQRAAS